MKVRVGRGVLLGPGGVGTGVGTGVGGVPGSGVDPGPGVPVPGGGLPGGKCLCLVCQGPVSPLGRVCHRPT